MKWRILLAIAALALVPVIAQAKRLAPGYRRGLVGRDIFKQAGADSKAFNRAHIHAAARGSSQGRRLSAVQEALTPFLELKAAGKLSSAPTGMYLPTEADIRFLARHWNSLDRAFLSLYKSAAYIPENFEAYVSPGGNFEIYYTTEGRDLVASTDEYGYGSGDNWRTKSENANGIPDYIDEVAWAFDSAWSMEIDRFGFKEPYPYKSTKFNSNRYKVKVCEQGYDFYGLTYVQDKIDSQPFGYSSYIEIRNNWDGWNLNDIIDYEDHPEKGIRITAVHEFFHSIQYAMSRQVVGDVYLDDFPISWIEGTAVLMEELGFDYVNDYTQYLEEFFTNPTMPMLDGTYDGLTEYKNSLIALYLYEYSGLRPGIDFIKYMFNNNTQGPIEFERNLTRSADQMNRTWSDLLGCFYTESYFTGSRSDSRYFIKDAAILGEWSVWPDDLDTANSVAKQVLGFGMQAFSYIPASQQAETLHVHFVSEDGDEESWSVKAIISHKYGKKDTIVDLSKQTNGLWRAAIPDWPLKNGVKVIAANADPLASRGARVYFADSSLDENFNKARNVAVFPNPASLRQGQGVTMIAPDLIDIRLYAADGSLIAHASIDRQTDKLAFDQVENGFYWKLKNRGGETIVPGSYIAVVGAKDPRTRAIRYSRKPVLIRP